MMFWFETQSHQVNGKCVQWLMPIMGIQGISPKFDNSLGSKRNKVYPYLHRELKIIKPNQMRNSAKYGGCICMRLQQLLVLKFTSSFTIRKVTPLIKLSDSSCGSFCLRTPTQCRSIT